MAHDDRLLGLWPTLRAAEASSPVEALESVTRELGTALGATSVSLLIADASGRAVVRLAHSPIDEATAGDAGGHRRPRRDDEESATVIPFDGGPAEQALRTQTVKVLAVPGASGAGRWRVLAPVSERGEAIGLLEMDLPAEPDRGTLAEIGRFAHVLAFVVIANSRHTDLFEWGQRTRRFSLSAEIQQRLLPGARTCEAGAFTLSAWLEPAASIGGDTFDYSLARDLLHFSVTDAMGHGVLSALTATVCMGSLRGTRREGGSLLEQVTSTSAALVKHAVTTGTDDFVTGLLGRVDLRTGSLEIVNAGHLPPYLARDGRVRPVPLPVDLPMGLFAESPYHSTELGLSPGDRLVVVTDGMLERNAASVDLPAVIEQTRSLHPRETVRAMADAVLEATGHALSDDATVLCLDWHGHHDHDRRAVSGADPVRASDPLA
ncbi:PP2C family protein-serine/threonine phosphatase [Angustibacter sp. Root456]|uniref:PP2C family protein-serine/threonine phosphatase n=1 Tax=Angustibacter sp. Root456 TaxID=1736539 RepID=UPI0006FB5911|nr:PP2C family protein-serine/threonine phosphatase [Angustibacter sp. Root456]KQX69787.1 serine/threonine protein phosphatase [Angustibacter sp. Root456]